MATLGTNTYGKTSVRLTHIDRTSKPHTVIELTVSILLEGEFDKAYIDGDNTLILPTDTMKNTVYALAKRLPWASIEQLGSGLAAHFLNLLPQVTAVTIAMEQVPWAAIGTYSSAFQQAGNERRTARIESCRSSTTVTSGFRGLQILKTANSSFAGFLKDDLTTLAETNDRLFGTILEADWNYSGQNSFNALHRSVRSILLNTFAEHNSLSVQHTMFAMGQAVLNASSEVTAIHMVMPNKHCLLVDLNRFGLENNSEVFVPIDEPSGYIEARMVR